MGQAETRFGAKQIDKLFTYMFWFPKVDFTGSKVKATRFSVPWPDTGGKPRRASLNSFGYGGANAHAVIEEVPAHVQPSHAHSFLSSSDALTFHDEMPYSHHPYTIILSANDASSLQGNIEAICNYLTNPRAQLSLPDLAYTLSERRSRLWHRAFVSTHSLDGMQPGDFTVGKKRSHPPTVGFIFTGQGAQWPAMGKELLEYFPSTRDILEELDSVLQSIGDTNETLRPSWSILRELSEPRAVNYIRQPELSQPLVTALQLCLVAILDDWGVKPMSVIGHSSGEIAAAYTSGFLDRAGAIKVAYFRGKAAAMRAGSDTEPSATGMLAIGLDATNVTKLLDQSKYIGHAWIACFNSPSSVTVSGRREALEELAEDVKANGHFARLIQVDLAYHSELMDTIGDTYEQLLNTDGNLVIHRRSLAEVSMFSTVTASKLDQSTTTDAIYWRNNMVSPVRFQAALESMMTQTKGKSPDILIEIGPSGALSGPVSQVLKSQSGLENVSYYEAWSRSSSRASAALFSLPGKLFIHGFPIDLAAVNEYGSLSSPPQTLVDLPNYSWNHSVKYWHETAPSRDWRFRRFVTHDLIGSKVPGIPWNGPICVWNKQLRLGDVPWLRDHQMGPDVLMPGAGFANMAIEAMYQKFVATKSDGEEPCREELAYHLRNMRFDRAMVIEEGKPVTILSTLSEVPDIGIKDWHHFRICTTRDGSDYLVEHSSGLVRVVEPKDEKPAGVDMGPLRSPQPFARWYKTQKTVGMHFGPSFRKVCSLEAVAGQRSCRAIVDMTPPSTLWEPQSHYHPFHPAVLDACLQVAMPANAFNERSLVQDLNVPMLVDDIIVNRVPRGIREGLSIARSEPTGHGQPNKAKGIVSHIGVYDVASTTMLMEVRGLHYIELDVGDRLNPHTFTYLLWEPDVSLLTQGQVLKIASKRDSNNATQVAAIIDLIAFKDPMLKVLEVNLNQNDESSLWFDERENSQLRACYSRCDLASPHVQTLTEMKLKHEGHRNTTFSLVNTDQEALGMGSQTTYDLIILKAGPVRDFDLSRSIRNTKPLLTESPCATLLVEHGEGPKSAAAESLEDDRMDPMAEAPASSLAVLPQEIGASESPESSPPTGRAQIDATWDCSNDSETWNCDKLPSSLKAGYFDTMLRVQQRPSSYLYRNRNDCSVTKEPHEPRRVRSLAIASISGLKLAISPSLRTKLEASGWLITNLEPLSSSFKNLKQSSEGMAILVLDDLSQPSLTNPSSEQWSHLQSLVSSGIPLLWVTHGSQHVCVTNPDSALVHGLFRVIRREQYGTQLTTLDVSGYGRDGILTPGAEDAIERVLDAMRAGRAEVEYVEQDGVLHIQRVMPDTNMSQLEHPDPTDRSLWEGDSTIQLHAERVGSLELTWCETLAGGGSHLDIGWVEMEVMAVGVNFKVSNLNGQWKITPWASAEH